MNPYPWKAQCALCKGDAVTTNDGNYAQWRGVPLVHRDPNLCLWYIEQREKKRNEAANT